MRRTPALAAVAAVLGGLVAPATAGAAAQTDYIVTLRAETGAPCTTAISGVTTDFAVTPTIVYTDSVCGFAAPLSKSKARDLAADARRVESVVVDSQITAG